jgi:hypothetical protein
MVEWVSILKWFNDLDDLGYILGFTDMDDLVY